MSSAADNNRRQNRTVSEADNRGVLGVGADDDDVDSPVGDGESASLSPSMLDAMLR